MLISAGNTISIVNPTFDNVGMAVHQTGGFPWIGIIDGKSINSGVTIKTETSPSFLVENLDKDTKSDIVQGPSGFILPSQSHLARFSYANTVGQNPVYTHISDHPSRPSYLAPGGRYPYVPAPNYATNPVSDFINIKDPSQNGGHTVQADNILDDAASLNAILQYAATNHKIAYFPFGKYRVESTLLIPPNSHIVGEAWSTITGAGPFFTNDTNPKPVIQIGNPNDVGTVHIQDMRFTVSEVLPGAIITQFHAAGSSPGDIAIWNSLITVGGVRGASGVTDTCRNPKTPCRAAFMGMHFAKTSSVYLENVWNWVADHITEDFDGGSNISGGRGVLIESTKGTWLHALGSEHWWLCQLSFWNAEGVMVSLLQSETNYDQGDNAPVMPPAPWTVDSGWGDPDFGWCGRNSRCRMGLANWWDGGKDVYSYASASWTFFSGPGNQPCAKGNYTCQNNVHWIQKKPGNLHLFGLCSKDTLNVMRLEGGKEILTNGGYTGGWPGSGGDAGRYTAS